MDSSLDASVRYGGQSMRIAVLVLAACGSATPSAVPDAAPAAPDAAPAALDAAPAAPDAPAPDAPAPDAPAPDAAPPPVNRFGIGVINTGTGNDLDRTAALVGRGGYVLLTLPGFTKTGFGSDGDLAAWQTAVRDAYARDLIPVLRIGPPWADRAVRNQSDDAQHLQYTTLAGVIAGVIAKLPRRAAWPLWVEVDNEPNQSLEWQCTEPGGSETDAQRAAEYASFLRDTTTALHAIAPPVLVINAGLSPPGQNTTMCGQDQSPLPPLTSIDFIHGMKAQVPDVFDHLDGWASHSFPASSPPVAWVPYQDGGPGLVWWKQELAAVGRDLPVLITESGWRTDSQPPATRDEVALWTACAWKNYWLDPTAPILTVTPFILRDPYGNFESFAFISQDGSTPYPVYDAMLGFRTTGALPGPCP
jgi:hypothetical protein